MRPPSCIVVMGVSGAGKTAVGRLLAERLRGHFIDADDLHPKANVDKMKRGVALVDADRWPWLDRVAQVIRDHRGAAPLVVACSALKRSYRRRLGSAYRLAYLKGTPDGITRRLENRENHFMPPSLLESQFATLEEPDDAMVLNADQPPNEIVEAIVHKMCKRT